MMRCEEVAVAPCPEAAFERARGEALRQRASQQVPGERGARAEGGCAKERNKTHAFQLLRPKAQCDVKRLRTMRRRGRES